MAYFPYIMRSPEGDGIGISLGAQEYPVICHLFLMPHGHKIAAEPPGITSASQAKRVRG